jgi:hypothetical protein
LPCIKVAFLIFQNSIKRETGSKPVLFPQLYANKRVVLYKTTVLIVDFRILSIDFLNLKSKIRNLKWNGKVNNMTRARRPAYYIEYQTFGKKGLGMVNSILFSPF